MNVADMLTGFAFKTTRRHIAQAKAKETLAAGRAKRSAMASKRQAEIPALVIAGKTAKEIAETYGLALMTIREEIRDAAKAGTITEAQAKDALPPVIHQRDRVYQKAHKATIAMRALMVEFVSISPKSIDEIAVEFHRSRAAILNHIDALELDGKVRRVNGYPYKIVARQDQGRPNAA